MVYSARITIIMCAAAGCCCYYGGGGLENVSGCAKRYQGWGRTCVVLCALLKCKVSESREFTSTLAYYMKYIR